MQELFVSFLQSMAYVFEVIFFIWVGKAISDLLASDEFDADDMIEEQNNLAVACRRGGLYLAIALGMVGSISGGGTESFTSSLLLIARDGVLITIFVLIARVINDNFIARGINNTIAVKSGNMAVGLVEGGSYIATGIIAYASFTGVGGPWWCPLVYFVLGQMTLVAVTSLYEVMTPFSMAEEIRSGNNAAAIRLAGLLIVMGFILQGAISGPFNGWAVDLKAFAVSTISGVIMLPLVLSAVVDRILLPGSKINTEIVQRESASIIVITSALIGLGITIGAVTL